MSRIHHSAVCSEQDTDYFTATMDQGPATFASPLPRRVRGDIQALLGLDVADLRPLPLQVVSTGLPYLIVPVTRPGLAAARIQGGHFEAWLADLGAKFVYVLEPSLREGRAWDNAGTVEDVATGSAAGPVPHSARSRLDAAAIELRQSRFVGRPSAITVSRDAATHLWVGGPVRAVASGRFDTPRSSLSNPHRTHEYSS